MTYFLDFDRTLFDVEAFIQKIIVRPQLATYPEYQALKEGRRPDRAAAFATLLSDGRLSFRPGELSPFFYPDVVDFINTHSSVIVTHGFLVWQKAKVESAFNGVSPIPVLYTEHEHKGPVLARILTNYQKPYVFVDDNLEELDSVATHLSDVSIYEMRRDGAEGSGRYPV